MPCVRQLTATTEVKLKSRGIVSSTPQKHAARPASRARLGFDIVDFVRPLAKTYCYCIRREGGIALQHSLANHNHPTLCARSPDPEANMPPFITPLRRFLQQHATLSSDAEWAAGTSKLAMRTAEVVRRTWDLGFTAFGGPPVHFQILWRRFVVKEEYREGNGEQHGGAGVTQRGRERERGWIDEQTVRSSFLSYPTKRATRRPKGARQHSSGSSTSPYFPPPTMMSLKVVLPCHRRRPPQRSRIEVASKCQERLWLAPTKLTLICAVIVSRTLRHRPSLARAGKHQDAILHRPHARRLHTGGGGVFALEVSDPPPQSP